ncbi:phage head-tail joining protein [Aeromonas rivuli]|uniref:phage head-tail joining protein n=1 Tax=Aeromonas rivuli TaxID=648794 RepID=UPI0005AA9371
MAFTQDDVNALDEAIASGELTVRIDGREVQYRSIDDLLKAKRHIVRLMARRAGARSSPLAGVRTCVDRGIR